jgi:hypothetical protein
MHETLTATCDAATSRWFSTGCAPPFNVSPLGVPALDPDETARAFITHGRRLAARRKHGAP